MRASVCTDSEIWLDINDFVFETWNMNMKRPMRYLLLHLCWRGPGASHRTINYRCLFVVSLAGNPIKHRELVWKSMTLVRASGLDIWKNLCYTYSHNCDVRDQGLAIVRSICFALSFSWLGIRPRKSRFCKNNNDFVSENWNLHLHKYVQPLFAYWCCGHSGGNNSAILICHSSLFLLAWHPEAENVIAVQDQLFTFWNLDFAFGLPYTILIWTPVRYELGSI